MSLAVNLYDTVQNGSLKNPVNVVFHATTPTKEIAIPWL